MLTNSAENGKQSVLTLDYLRLIFCMRDSVTLKKERERENKYDCCSVYYQKLIRSHVELSLLL